MRVPSTPLLPLPALLLILWTLFVPPAWGQPPATLAEGIRQYQLENYEEAIELLTEVRKRDRRSAAAAFFLGMAHKQALDYPQAAAALRDAATLEPPVREALLELADALYRLGRLGEAREWLGRAERERVAPARTAFLRGLVLQRENDHRAAIPAFLEAKRLDPSFGQAAEFQIAISQMKERRLVQARERFRAVVQADALSDLAVHARQYQALLEQAIDRHRPLRLTVGLLGGYDSNVISKPVDAAAAGAISDGNAALLSTSARLDYLPLLDGPWLFGAQAAVSSTVHSRFTHSHDAFSGSLSLAPGYDFGPFSVHFSAAYTNALLRTDPDPVPSADSRPGYKRYLDYLTLGPTLRVPLDPDNILEVFLGYDRRSYHHQKASNPESIRDSVGLREYIGWIRLFGEGGFLNLRYDFHQEHADGIYWESITNRLSASLSLPLLPAERASRTGQLSLQLTGGAAWQDFRYEQPWIDPQGRPGMTRRRDRLYTGSVGLAWAFSPRGSLIVQAARTKNDSTIPLNSYERDQYLAGIEFRY